jgi:hypothetical protein
MRLVKITQQGASWFVLLTRWVCYSSGQARRIGHYGAKRNYYRVWEGTCRILTILEIRLR